ncbi:phosphatidylinositol 3,4,5-trisphosphate 5-phosphatase 2 [Pyxicephalus adspersus]|uniref:phosphatidylinositol 3,4,5-trisphosphate 5-phosphatase 2 n=1 Tax=Pyxicephalus adspersus TaxID=30357 RepID=UPI003B5AA040
MASGGVGQGPVGNMALPWYHRDLSRAAAEELLAKAGRDGSFLVRDSESVSGAYALCVLFQKHVHTYRILPDEEDYLAVQTSLGVQVRRFKTLGDLIALYLQPNQGMVCTLLYPVEREKDVIEDRDYSDGEDEKPPLPPRSASASFSGGSGMSLMPCGQDAVSAESSTNGLSTISHEYLKGSYALDLEAVKSGATNLPHLNKTLVVSCKRLHGEVDKVLSGLEILSKIFDQQSSPIVSKILQQAANQSGEPELESLVLKLSILKDFLSSIEKKALKALQDMSSSAQSAPIPQSSRKVKTIPVQTFEVKLDMLDLSKIVKSQKYTLSVDVDGGKLVVMKKVKDSQEDWNTFTHDKIRQLIKSQRVPSKLGIVFEREKDKTQRKDFIFASIRKREAFCQLLQLMKNKHSNQDEPDMISVFIGTWNMGSVPPQKNISSWTSCKGLGKTLDEMAVTIPHDIYVFGTQENSVTDKEWVDFLRGMLKDSTEVEYRPVRTRGSNPMLHIYSPVTYQLVAYQFAFLLQAVQSSAFTGCMLVPRLWQSIFRNGYPPSIFSVSLLTPLCFPAGNKGAVGISFMFNGTSFGFVNCHLTSGNEKTARRNQNYLDILRLLSLGDKQLNSFDISLRFTHLFWFGDLNYRLDMDVQEILNFISRKEFDPLLKVDQLNLEKEKNKIFLRFSEEEISYPPTYRYERGSRDTYVWHKHKPTGVSQLFIYCFSDSTGHLSTRTAPYLSRLTTLCTFYFFLIEYKKSSENDSQSIDNVNFLKVQWSSRQLPTLRPIVSEIEYLQDQHLLLTVKSMDGYESYGECVIALKSMIGSTTQQFLTYLSHRGEETGNIRGSMRVRVPAERMGTRERLYEWISIDKDETGAVKGKPPTVLRPNQDFSKSASRKHPVTEALGPTLGKLFEEPEKGPGLTTGRPTAVLPTSIIEDPALTRCKMEAQGEGDGLGLKNSFNNPAYYVLEGVPHQMLPPDGQLGSSTAKNKVQITVPAQHLDKRRQYSPSARGEDTSSDDEVGTLNLPPPDFPPPPLPKSAEFEMLDNPFYVTSSELHVRPAVDDGESRPGAGKPRVGVTFSEPPETKFHLKSQSRPPVPTPQPSYMTEAHGTMQDDRSCSVLQMARTLSEVDYTGNKETQGRPPHLMAGKSKMELPSRCMDYNRPLVFPPHCIRESIQEDEEALYHGGRSSSSLQGSSVGEWLRAIGMEQYEEGLIHNGWDDLEFLSDIVEEDLEEAGVLDPNHKKKILDNLQLRK